MHFDSGCVFRSVFSQLKLTYLWTRDMCTLVAERNASDYKCSAHHQDIKRSFPPLLVQPRVSFHQRSSSLCCEQRRLIGNTLTPGHMTLASSANQRPVLRSCDQCAPIRGQCSLASSYPQQKVGRLS